VSLVVVWLVLGGAIGILSQRLWAPESTTEAAPTPA